MLLLACFYPGYQIGSKPKARGGTPRLRPRAFTWTVGAGGGAVGAGMADGSILAMRMEGQTLLSDGGGGSGDHSSKYNSRPKPMALALRRASTASPPSRTHPALTPQAKP